MYDREKRYVNLVILAVTLYGLIQGLAYTYAPEELKGLVGAAWTLLPILVLLIGKHRLFSILIRLLDWQLKEKRLPARWDIKIEFDEKEAKHIRFGHFSLSKSVLGLKIEGQNLHDALSNEKTMQRWEGREVFYLDRGSTELIVYIYQTYEEKSETSVDRIGIVVAGRPTGDTKRAFIGTFHDYASSDTERSLRQGSVRLIPGDG